MIREQQDYARIESVTTVHMTCVQFIKGLGTEADPLRSVTQYWMEGKLIAEQDPNKEKNEQRT